MTAAVVVCTWGGIPPGAAEVLTLGRKVAGGLATELVWLTLGPTPDAVLETASRYGVARVDRIADPALARFRPDVHLAALAQYCAAPAPRLLLLPQTFDARLLAPRLAGRTGAGVVMNGVDLAVEDGGRVSVTAAAYGGDTRVVYALAGAPWYVVGLTAGGLVAEPAAAAGAPALRDVAVDLGGVEERIRVVGRAETTGPRIEDAEIIVAGGRGLGSAENFRLVEDLAAALGGMAAASRPIVDDGWVDPSRQVGLTGKITRPTLYIAAGISGASQHMVGCAAAKTIVAINSDPDAAIFRYARYGIVGNCLEVLPELVRAVKA